MQTTNSLSDFLKKILRLNDFNLKILTGLTSSFITEEDSVEVVLLDENDVPITYSIPSYSYIRKKLDGIDRDAMTLYDLHAQSKFQPTEEKKVIEPEKISNLDIPISFNKLDNNLIKNLTNYSVFTELDLTDRIDIFTKEILTKKIIITETLDKDINDFSNLSYEKVINELINLKVNYTEENLKIDLDPPLIRYKGVFNVSEILEEVTDITYGTARKYKFSTIYYTDNITNTLSQKLAPGDILVTSDNLREYSILKIDDVSVNGTLEYHVTMGLKSGFGLLELNDQLRLASTVLPTRLLKIPININEKNIIFTKPIDPYSNVASSDWSGAVPIITNDLKATFIINDKKETFTFENFYKKYIKNFTTYIEGIYKDFAIPAYVGIQPSAPELIESNFKVVRINGHLLNQNTNVLSIQQLLAELSALSISETEKYNILYSPTKTTEEREAARAALYDTGGIVQRKLEKQTALNDIYKNQFKNKILTAEPKYRIRGFWAIPDPQEDFNGKQNIIQFKVRYRYKDVNNQEIVYPSYSYSVPGSDSKITAAFSNWIEVYTPIRKKIKNEIDDIYEWANEDVTNSNIVNINQLDIPISPNEIVEFEVYSISEAGWPMNPLISEASNQIQITFPEELLGAVDTSTDLKDQLTMVNLEYEISLLTKPLFDEISLIKSELTALKSLKVVTDLFVLSADDITNISNNPSGNSVFTLNYLPKDINLIVTYTTQPASAGVVHTLPSGAWRVNGKLLTVLHSYINELTIATNDEINVVYSTNSNY